MNFPGGDPLRTTLLILSLAAALALTPASAALGQPAGACGLMTSPQCWIETFSCRIVANTTPPCLPVLLGASFVSATCGNSGVILMVTVLGTNRYCADGDCVNEGVIVMVGQSYSCMGNGLFVVCVQSVCQNGGVDT